MLAPVFPKTPVFNDPFLCHGFVLLLSVFLEPLLTEPSSLDLLHSFFVRFPLPGNPPAWLQTYVLLTSTS